MTRTDRGFALPVTIFAMVIAAVIITGATFMAHQESRIGSAVQFSGQAFRLSEQGLAETMAAWKPSTFASMALWADTTFVDSLTGGVASTKVTRLSDRLYLLESTSEVTDGGALRSGATREAGIVVRLFSPEIPMPAALTTRGPTELRGNAEVHGEDEVPAGWGALCSAPLADKIGILNDDATQVTTIGGSTISGAPAVQEDTTISNATFTEFGGMNWTELTDLADKVLSGGTINGTGPVSAGGVCSTGVPTNWGDPTDPTSACGDYFPIIHIAGTASIQSGGVGQGILLVDGNLDLRGGFTFKGIIIVQGAFETQGNGNRVHGGVLAGNATIDNQVITGGSEITNSTCAVSRAILNSGLTRPRALQERSWVDLSSVRR